MQPSIVFMGTPEFAVPALERLAGRVPPDRLLVVTQLDRPAGRGRRLQPPPVKVAAERLGLEVLQVETLRDPEVRARLEAFAPDLIVVGAFGRILPKWVLALPRRGCVNLHASDLPRFRGASPIAAAIACGDGRTAVALMVMEAGLDTGPVFDRAFVDITSSDTTESLTGRLAAEGAGLLEQWLDRLLAGEAIAEPQRGEVIETRRIVKAHGAIDWRRPADELERHVRAMWPWPRAWTVGRDGSRIQVHAAEVAAAAGVADPGVVVAHDNGIVVATGDGALRLLRVQLAGKSAHDARQLTAHPAFIVGGQLSSGVSFVEPEPWIVATGEA